MNINRNSCRLINEASILIVDDTPYNIQLLSQILAKQGYKVCKATHGQMALDLAQNDPPDLVLLDIRMPDMNGFEVCTRLKADPRTSEIPVVFISAIDDAVEKVEAFSVGGVDYINKPFQLLEVLARIETHLRLRSLQLQLQEQNVQLQAATTALSKALEQERELSQLKSNFISIVSHEFRTPLTTIQSSAELLEYYDWTREEQVEQLHQIQSEVQHMTALMEDVLLFSKAEVGKLKLTPVSFDLIKFCQDLVKQLKHSTGEHHQINFTVNFTNSDRSHQNSDNKPDFASQSNVSPNLSDAQTAMVCMDAKLLRQILSNLLSNAIKYSAAGSTVDFVLTLAENNAIFFISDQGIGIPIEDQQHLFTSFHRAKNVDTIPGTGLGLSIVKKCVDVHQGTVMLSSDIGVGTTFRITIPLDCNSTNSY